MSTGGKDERPLTDAEIVALAAIVTGDAAEVLTANAAAQAKHGGVAYADFASEAYNRLTREMQRRGVLS